MFEKIRLNCKFLVMFVGFGLLLLLKTKIMSNESKNS